jgi:hypothetical protein
VLGDDVGDADAVDVLHHQVRATVGGDAGVVDRRHAGMLKARGDPGFAVKAPHQLRVVDPVGEPDEFDRDAAVEPQIAGAPDLAHATAPDRQVVERVAVVEHRPSHHGSGPTRPSARADAAAWR